MAWTKVTKPTGPTYTLVNPAGRTTYDQPDITYDDSTIYYDGVNESLWTSINKPDTDYTWDTTVYTWDAFSHQWQSPTWTIVQKPT